MKNNKGSRFKSYIGKKVKISYVRAVGNCLLPRELVTTVKDITDKGILVLSRQKQMFPSRIDKIEELT
jgi:hypothetical protein